MNLLDEKHLRDICLKPSLLETKDNKTSSKTLQFIDYVTLSHNQFFFIITTQWTAEKIMSLFKPSFCVLVILITTVFQTAVFIS